MSTWILGVSALYHDSAAALLKDGVLVAAASEERFSRLKHDASLPVLAARWCLEQAGIQARDLDHLVYYE
jgi:carbamoyltransferase